MSDEDKVVVVMVDFKGLGNRASGGDDGYGG